MFAMIVVIMPAIIEGREILDAEVIRPVSDPFSKEGGIAVLKGNVAPDAGPPGSPAHRASRRATSPATPSSSRPG